MTKYSEGKNMKKILLPILLAGCTSATNDNTIILPKQNPIHSAAVYINYSEDYNRQELKEFIGVDPVRVEWCAAFVNSVLEETGIPSNKNHKYPLTARAFLDWGHVISKDDISPGDVVVFPRGNQGWQGHVGFYIRTVTVGDTDYYAILGGNQNDKVSIELFLATTALGIRRNIN